MKFDNLSAERQMVLRSETRVDLLRTFDNRSPNEVVELFNSLKTSYDNDIMIFSVGKETHYSSFDDDYWEEDILYLLTYRQESDFEYNTRMLTLDEKREKARLAAERKREREEKAKIKAQLAKEKEAARVEAQERKIYEKLKKKFEKA